MNTIQKEEIDAIKNYIESKTLNLKLTERNLLAGAKRLIYEGENFEVSIEISENGEVGISREVPTAPGLNVEFTRFNACDLPQAIDSIAIEFSKVFK